MLIHFLTERKSLAINQYVHCTEADKRCLWSDVSFVITSAAAQLVFKAVYNLHTWTRARDWDWGGLLGCLAREDLQQKNNEMIMA